MHELEDHRLLEELFPIAYERSVEPYREVRQTLGEPDPFRLLHFDRIASLIGDAVREGSRLEEAASVTALWAEKYADEGANERDSGRWRREAELLGLNESDFARFGLRPYEFRRWQALRNDGGGPSR